MKIKLLFIFLIVIIYSTYARRWEPVEVPAPYSNNYWLDVFFLPSNPNFGWVCGFNGMTLRTTDAGNTWFGSIAPDADHLESIHFPTAQIGYTSGPEGIWKSTNGGATWLDITPPTLVGLWGNYFLNENLGVVLGGGCATRQEFWHTTDGGTTWTVFPEFENNTGLTDALLYEDGLGFASSSGHIWITLNFGQSWEILHDTGTNVWQEEITFNNGGFLIPTAGITCTGQGDAGGFRYFDTRDQQWYERDLRTPMFGSFMMDEQSGWIVGNNRTVVYAENYFQDVRMRNCGIEDGSLDDIWMVEEHIGWVVGDGVYKLSPPTLLTSRDSLNFTDVCLGQPIRDTLLIENANFYASDVRYAILGVNPNNFRLIDLPEEETLASCSSKLIIVEFSPTDNLPKSANLAIAFNQGSSSEQFFNIPLYGNSIGIDAQLDFVEIVINPAYCNTKTSGFMRWNSIEGSNTIIAIDFEENQGIFSRDFSLPMRITSPNLATNFSAFPLDTGWYETTVLATTEPCDTVHRFKLRAYGVSPIINANQNVRSTIFCDNEVFDTIPIYNTGNHDLIIDRYQLTGANNRFSIIEWIGTEDTDIIVEPNDTVYVVIRYNNSNYNDETAVLTLFNNDSTKTRGHKNPYRINLSGVLTKSDVSVSKSEIDLGTICIGDSVTQEITFRNNGNINAQLINISENDYFTIKNINIGNSINSGELISSIISFAPEIAGDFEEEITLIFEPCGEELVITVSGTANELILEADREFINSAFQAGVWHNEKLNISSQSFGDVRVTDCYFNPPLGNFDFRLSPDLFVFLLPEQGVTFDLEFFTDALSEYEGEICFVGEGECPAEVCVPINLSSIERLVRINPSLIEFGRYQCQQPNEVEVISITNNGLSVDSIRVIELRDDNNAFEFLGEFRTYEVNQSGALDLEVAFNPQTQGVFNATLVIETYYDGTQRTEIPLTGEFYASDINPKLVEIDLGVFENCSAEQQVIVDFANDGLLDDWLDLSSENEETRGVVLTSPSVQIASQTSEIIELIIDPSYYDNEYDEEIDYTFVTRECGDVINLKITFKIEKAEIEYSPNPIVITSSWVNRLVSREITIANNSEIDVEITEANFTDFAQLFEVDEDFPIDMPANSTKQITLNFLSPSAGTFNTQIEFTEKSECENIGVLSIEAVVPEERYSTTLRIGDYNAIVGDNITIALELLSDVDNLTAEVYNWEISFNHKVFHPKNVRLAKDNSELNYNYSNGRLSGTIESPNSLNLLKDVGNLIYIEGIVLAGKSKSTILDIVRFEPVGHVVDFTLEDGQLTVEEYCDIVSEIGGVSLLPNYEVQSMNYSNNTINFDIKADSKQKVKVSLLNMLGNTVTEKSFDIEQNNNTKQISVSGLPRGIYFLKFSNQNGIKYMEKIIVN